MRDAEVKITLGERVKRITESTAVSRSNVSLQSRKTKGTDSAARSGFISQGLPSRVPILSRKGNPGGY